MTDKGSEPSIWTPANIVTLLRICGVPVFVVAIVSPWPEWVPWLDAADPWRPLVATIIFVVLAATDGVDGYLARSRNEVTTFGKFIDPLADKILVAAALLVLVELQVVPSWVALIILCREFIVSGIRMVAASSGVVIAASWYGKAKTVTQIIAIALFLAKDLYGANGDLALQNPLYLIAWVIMIAALVLTIISMLDYFSKARHLLGLSSKQHDAVQTAGDQGMPSYISVETPVTESTQHATAMAEKAALIIERASAAHCTIGTAESLTGGLIAAALTSVPGSSQVVAGGIVSYQERVKVGRLDVPERMIADEGVVSEAVACSMAVGARRELCVDIAVAVTGIAGPSGAQPGNPVGTVWLAVADDGGARAERFEFSGGREDIRAHTVDAALEALVETIPH